VEVCALRVLLLSNKLSNEYLWLQLWCAAAVNITSSRTRDGGSIVGTSVFYSDVADDVTSTPQPITDEVEQLNQELQVLLLLLT